MPNGDVIGGGLFPSAGSVSANNIARWDGASWQRMGTGGTNNGVRFNGRFLAGFFAGYP